MTHCQNTWDEEVVPRCIKVKQVHRKLIQLACGTSVEPSANAPALAGKGRVASPVKMLLLLLLMLLLL
jgi:hypothetical protein